MLEQAKASLVSKFPLTREGLSRILSDNGFDIVQSVNAVSELREGLDVSASHHMILLDCPVISPDIEREISEVHQRFPSAKIIVLKEEFDLELARVAFRAGAHGYILRDVSLEIFVANLRLILLDQKVAPTNFVEMLGTGSGDANHDKASRPILTSREQDILSRIAIGQPNKVISRELHFSESLVKLCLKGIYKKLEVRNRTEAAVVARDQHLVIPVSQRNKILSFQFLSILTASLIGFAPDLISL